MKNVISIMLILILFISMIKCSKDDTQIKEPILPLSTADIESEKLNVFYTGINNPIKINTNNINNELNVEVVGEGSTIEKVNQNEYNVKVTKPVDAIEVKIYDGEKLIKTESFKVDRIPNPIVALNNNYFSATIRSNEFRSINELNNIKIPNFNYSDALCKVEGFTLTKISNRQSALVSNNSGSLYNNNTVNLVVSARPGDYYLFTNIKVKCSGDQSSRKISPLVYKII